MGDVDTLNKNDALPINAAINHAVSGAYMRDHSQFPNRDHLVNVSVRDPGNHANHIQLEMITHHTNPNLNGDGFKGMAFITTDPKTHKTNLIIVYPGVDPTHPLPVLGSMVHGNDKLQAGDVIPFMKDMAQTIQQRHLHIDNTTILAHSIGGPYAVTTLAMAIEEKKLGVPILGETTPLFGNKIPKTVMLEDWGGRQAANEIVRETANHGSASITLHDIEKNIVSARHGNKHNDGTYFGTFVNQPENKPLGRLDAILPVKEAFGGEYAYSANSNDHRAMPTVAKLLNGDEVVQKNFNHPISSTGFYAHMDNSLRVMLNPEDALKHDVKDIKTWGHNTGQHMISEAHNVEHDAMKLQNNAKKSWDSFVSGVKRQL